MALLSTRAPAQSPDPRLQSLTAPRTPNDTTLAGKSIPDLLATARVPGLSLAIIENFQIVATATYGIADVVSNRPVTTSTRFHAASISKPVAALAAMRLVQDRRITLDENVNSYLKTWRIPNSEHTRTQPVTLRSLLSHTSGADDGFGFPGYHPDSARPTTVQIIKGERPANRGPVLFARPPFARFKYSGGGTTIVQLALTDLTGADFAEHLRTRVLEPLGMRESSFEQPPPARVHDQLARAHNFEGGPWPAIWNVYPELAAAGLWTTPSDLARVVIEVQNALRGARTAFLTTASAREMTTPVGVGPVAVGFFVAQVGEGWYFSHGGSNRGFRAHLEGHLRHGYGVVIMTNGDAGGRVIAEVRERVARVYGWDSKVEPLRR